MRCEAPKKKLRGALTGAHTTPGDERLARRKKTEKIRRCRRTLIGSRGVIAEKSYNMRVAGRFMVELIQAPQQNGAQRQDGRGDFRISDWLRLLTGRILYG